VSEPFVQFLGRLHPLVLHLPLGLLAALVALELLARRRDVSDARRLLAALTAAAALAAAGTGWLLGHAPDRQETELVERHEQLGLCLAAACLLAGVLARRARPLAYRVVLLVALALAVPAGHLGATLTHGEDFLLEPLRARPAAPGGDAFADVIAPLLAARCGACHGAERSKGGLRLDSPEGLRAGGRHGPVLGLAGGEGELLRRVRLPPDDEDHMPPEGKPQLMPDELAALVAWLDAGAPFEGPVDGLPAALAPPVESAPLAATEPAAPAVPSADPSALAALASALVHAEPLEPASPLLWVDASAVADTLDDTRARALLEPLRLQVAELSLARAPVGDALLPLLADMPSLQRLDVSRTRVTGAGLAALAGHPRLRELRAVRAPLGDAAAEALAALPALRRAYLWEAGLSDAALERLATERPELELLALTPADAEILEVEPPVVVGSAALPGAVPSLAPVNATCPVSGSPVDPAFALVFEGRVIGFCCARCPGSFLEDPAAFRGRLP
jgi:uncharacterized membrane protein